MFHETNVLVSFLMVVISLLGWPITVNKSFVALLWSNGYISVISEFI